MQGTATTLIALALCTLTYAVVLELMRKHYETRWTWLTVVVGVTLVGLFVRWRFTLGLPDLNGAALADWCWWQWVWHFCAGGAPIVGWQIWQDRRLLLRALDYTKGQRG